MDASPHISLVFVNYRSAQYLAAALRSLFSFERATDFFEVIVVNNDVSERPVLLELKQSFPFVLIESGENIGFGRGGNLGARQARGEIIGFINPDVLWTGMRLRGIAGVFDGERNIGILGMALLGADKEPEPWSAGDAPSLANLFRNNFLLSRRAPWSKESFSFPDWVSGGALFIRAGLFSEIGGFDGRFFLYFEDVDLCAEARKRGFLVARHGAFPLIHLGGRSSRSTNLQKKYFYGSQKKYFEKRRPAWEGEALRLLRSFFRISC
ncbi:MAG: glycosyltransferase family 2 protein [Candidatus Moraniibacteriota bacterium]